MGNVIQTRQKPIVQHRLDIGNFTFYPNIIVGEFSEGVHVSFENATIPIQIATQLFGDKKPLIYISNRKNSYSMNPVGYKEVVDLFPNFKAFGIIAQTKRRRMLANLESVFIKKPMRVFDNLEDALSWAEEILKTESKS